jgi:hypothetical protein
MISVFQEFLGNKAYSGTGTKNQKGTGEHSEIFFGNKENFSSEHKPPPWETRISVFLPLDNVVKCGEIILTLERGRKPNEVN